MSKTIYYFSATGNSLQTALDIAEGIGDTEIISVAKAGKNVKSDSEVIGFVYPVFAGGLPNMVHDFIQSGNWKKDAYIFAIATCGMSAGGANYEIDKLLRQQGTHLSYGMKLCMGTNYIVLYDLKPEARNKILAKADRQLKVIISDLNERKSNRWSRGTAFSRKRHKKIAATYKTTDMNYIVSDSCRVCGQCSSICPAKNIQIIDNKPKFLHQCEHCMACIHWCPQKAINVSNKTQSRSRYHHPKVNVEQIK